jgi:16S rRNA (cytosine1402-N4)-methyltransferase
MLDEVLQWLALRPGMRVVDGTFGGGGHARAIAPRVQPGGSVLGIDRDVEAIERPSPADPTATADPTSTADAGLIRRHGSYEHLPQHLQSVGWSTCDGVLLDLGLSSDQLAADDRGFSFHASGALDLRFDTSSGPTAAQWLSQQPEIEIARAIYEYGEERHSRRIAKAIVEQRRKEPIRTAPQLAALVRRVVPISRAHPIDPATRTFQALRIAVNDELGALQRVLKRLPECLAMGGRVAIITFHSLEDRIVKHALRDGDCWDVLTRKPILPSDEEVSVNRRARSAKLRVAQRIDPAAAASAPPRWPATR